jgi:hypothetical protein
MANSKIFILKSVASGQLIGYILDRPKNFSTMTSVTMVVICCDKVL